MFQTVLASVFDRGHTRGRNWCDYVRWRGWLANGFLVRSIWRRRAWLDGIWPVAPDRIREVSNGESETGTENWTKTGEKLSFASTVADSEASAFSSNDLNGFFCRDSSRGLKMWERRYYEKEGQGNYPVTRPPCWRTGGSSTPSGLIQL